MSVEFDSVNKIINFGSGMDKMWMNIKNKSLNNVNSIVFRDSQLKGVIDDIESLDLSDLLSDYSNYAVSVNVVADVINDMETNYASKEHKHNTNDIYRLDENEEEESLDNILDGKVILITIMI